MKTKRTHSQERILKLLKNILDTYVKFCFHRSIFHFSIKVIEQRNIFDYYIYIHIFGVKQLNQNYNIKKM